MKTIPLFIGDANGLQSANDTPKKSSTGFRTKEDLEFAVELRAQRTAAQVSARNLSLEAGYSHAYVSMIERGDSRASEETKRYLRETLSYFEELHKKNHDQ